MMELFLTLIIAMNEQQKLNKLSALFRLLHWLMCTSPSNDVTIHESSLELSCSYCDVNE